MLLIVPVALSLTLNALTPAFGDDAALYHLSEVRWVADFGTVPGLANLHGRFGFNSALAPLAGLLSTGVGLAIGRQMANALVVLVAAVFALDGWTWRTASRVPGTPVYQAAAACGFLALAWSTSLSSPQADVAGAAVTLAAGCALWRWLAGESAGPSALTVLLAVSLAAQLKLSYAPYAAVGAAVVLAIQSWRNRRPWPVILVVLLATVVPYFCRSYLLSGYPLYPLPAAGLPVDWAVPVSAVRLERAWVLSWARQPGVPYARVFADAAWLRSWWPMALRHPSFLWPGSLCLLGCVAAFPAAFLGPRPSIRRLGAMTLALLPPVLGVVAWLLSAPDPRFVEGTLWTLGATLLALGARLTTGRRWWLQGVGAATGALFVALGVTSAGRLAGVALRCPNYVPPAARCQRRLTQSGLVVYVPVTTYAPGDAPLPNTVSDRFDPGLQSRGRTLRDGFRTTNPHPTFGPE